MRSISPTIVSVLLVLSASHLGCAGAEEPLDPPDPPATEAPAPRVAGPDPETSAGPSKAPPAEGATSAAYPAPHPGMPQIPRNGGVVLHDPLIVSVTFAGDPLEQKIKAFGEQIGDLAWWSTVHAGYGVGPARSVGHVTLHEVPAASISDAEVERWVAARVSDGTLPAPTDQTIYTVYYPSQTTVTLTEAGGSAASCQTFLGYHSTVMINYRGQSISIAYAVVNRCSADIDQLTVTASHELTEASTDPHPIDARSCGYVALEDNAWTGLGGENGDMCAGVSAAREAGWALTRVWNNVTAAAGDQPCLPAPDTGGVPYYNAGIVHEILAIPPGYSASTEVDCYAFGPLSGPMSLGVQLPAQSPLKVSLDRRSCTNGDVATLTVAVGAGVSVGLDHHYTLLTSLGPQSAHLWRGMVHVQ